jgi:serine phosphatase RsbU (regulator of sigma subunit)
MKKIIICLLLIVSVVNVFANKSLQDSLTTFTSESEALNKIHKYLEVSEQKKASNIEESIIYARSAAILAQKIENHELQQKSEFATGFAYYSKNDFEKAISHFDLSLRMSRKLYDKYNEALSLNRLGNTFQLMGKYEKSLVYYEQAMTINKALEDKQEIARTLTNLGSVYRLYGNYELAINQHLEALGIYEGLQNDEGIAWSALNIGRLFKMMKNYQKSIEYVNQSLFIYQKIEDSGKYSTGVTLCLKEKGSIYYEMGNLDKAIKFSEQVLSINEETGNRRGVANSLSSLGKVYFNSQNYKQAEKYLKDAIDLKDVLNDNTEKASILRYLGRIYLSKGKFHQAGIYLNKSLKYALNQNLKEDVKEVYLSLSILNENIHNSKKALEYYKEYTLLKEKLNNQEINELELQYEFDKKQRLLEFEQQQREIEQKARLQKQKIFTWVFVAGFLFMIVIAYLIFGSYKRKKKTNEILRKQKDEIEEQKDEIEAQRDFVTKQRDQISHQNTIITDSIEYAKRIQTALFPQEKFMNQVLTEHFVFMKPKNIVSGDFYWLAEKDNKIVVTVSDCTGHGVPGAFMSMLGIAFLNEIVNKTNKIAPNVILDQLRRSIIESLHQEYGVRGSKDGMDMALCIIDKESNQMQFSGAYNSVIVVRDKEVHELKADKMPIGIHAVKLDKGFENKEFELKKNDMLYLYSDGYIDQFGGEDGHKFKNKSFKELLINISELPLDKQKMEIEKTMEAWQGDQSQLDDMMVMGVKI